MRPRALYNRGSAFFHVMPNAPLIDVRPESAFLAGHEPSAVGIPLEELAGRVHELPPPGTSIRLTDADPQRIHRATQWLAKREYVVSSALLDPAGLVEQGRSRVRLWQPNPFLIESLQVIGSAKGA